MSAQQIINAALAARGMTPINPVCPGCGDVLDRDDFPALSDYPATGEAVIARYGKMICHGCIEQIVLCDECGKAITDAEIYDTDNYGTDTDMHTCSSGCTWRLSIEMAE